MTAFNKQRDRTDGLQSECRECHRRRFREYYDETIRGTAAKTKKSRPPWVTRKSDGRLGSRRKITGDPSQVFVCKICEHIGPQDDFVLADKTRVGARCKPCNVVYWSEYRKRNSDKINESSRRWYKRNAAFVQAQRRFTQNKKKHEDVLARLEEEW